MRWLVGLAAIGFAAAAYGWLSNIPELICPGLWLMAPLGALMVVGAVSAVLFGRGKGRATYLKVPFAEKNQAKAVGARWDSKARSWCVPPGVNTAPVGRWLRTGSAG